MIPTTKQPRVQPGVADLREASGNELANLLDWWGMLHHDPGILSTKTGRLQMTYDVRFLDTEQMEADERGWYLARVDEILKVLDEGWALDADWWHEPTSAYPQTDWDALQAPASDRLVDSIRHLDFRAHPRHTSRLWLTPSWQPPASTRHLLRNIFLTRQATRKMAETIREDITAFRDGNARFVGFLRPVLDHIEALDADALCTYLHRGVSWHTHAITCPSPAYDLDWQLTSDLWLPGRPPVLGGRLIQPLTIKSWSPTVRTYVPEALSTLPFPCRYHVRWVPKGLRSADQFLTWAEKRWAVMYKGVSKLLGGTIGTEQATEVAGRDEQDGAINAGQSIIDLRRAVRRGETVVGQLSPTVLCWSDTVVREGHPASLEQAQWEVDERVKAVSEALFRQGLVVRVEQPNASIQWLATIPGHVKYGIRGRVLDSPVLTAMIPHHHRWTGPARDEYLQDEPLMVLSSDGAPFNVVTHVGNLGHVLIAGPSQTGKTTFVSLAVRQSARYRGRRGVIFDRDYNLKPVTLLSGGKHYALGAPGCVPLQPLGNIDTPDDQALRAIWVEDVLVGEGLAPDADERREILRMIRALARLPRRQRTVSMARKLLQVKHLKVGLEPFCAGGEYDFLDGTAEAFDWHNHLLCFEMSALIKKPRALTAVLSYCFQELETHWMTGAPVYIWLDEFKWLLEMPRVVDAFEEWLLARAKKNVAVWASIQELVYLQRSKVWQAILSNMPTKFLLPNAQALKPDIRRFYEEIGVTERGLHQLAAAQPFRDILYTSPLGTRLCQSRLSPVERLLCAANKMEELAVLDALAAQHSPEELPGAWLRHHGYPDEAAYLELAPAQGTPADEKEDVCLAPSASWSVPSSWEALAAD